jgi:hypothetical protein
MADEPSDAEGRRHERINVLEKAEIYWWLLFSGAVVVLFVTGLVVLSFRERLVRIEASLTRIERQLEQRP